MTSLPLESEQRAGASRIRTLDGMRGLAALGVMFFHFANQLDPVGLATTAFKSVLVTGPRLELFFVLSGFLVTGIPCDSKTRPGY